MKHDSTYTIIRRSPTRGGQISFRGHYHGQLVNWWRIILKPWQVRVSSVDRRIEFASVRTGPTRSIYCLRPFQRCDVFGPTRPASPIPGLNLGKVYIGVDAGGRRECPPAYAMGPQGSDPDVTLRCWRVGACTGRDDETRNGINTGGR
jgi:hypothetical protein